MSTGEVRLPWICPAVTGLACRYKGNLKTQIARYFRKFPIWAIDALYKSPPDLDIERFGDHPPYCSLILGVVFYRLLHRSHFLFTSSGGSSSSRQSCLIGGTPPSLYFTLLRFFSHLRIWHYFGAYAHFNVAPCAHYDRRYVPRAAVGR